MSCSRYSLQTLMRSCSGVDIAAKKGMILIFEEWENDDQSLDKESETYLILPSLPFFGFFGECSPMFHWLFFGKPQSGSADSFLRIPLIA